VKSVNFFSFIKSICLGVVELTTSSGEHLVEVNLGSKDIHLVVGVHVHLDLVASALIGYGHVQTEDQLNLNLAAKAKSHFRQHRHGLGKGVTLFARFVLFSGFNFFFFGACRSLGALVVVDFETAHVLHVELGEDHSSEVTQSSLHGQGHSAGKGFVVFYTINLARILIIHISVNLLSLHV